MIFVTVGTHEQQFNRLLKTIDLLVKKKIIDEEVFIQTGYSTYQPKYCKWEKLIPYEEMVKKVSEARIVITHGAPSSFIMPLQIGKTPVVVPRRAEYKEHVNNHQVEFSRAVAERMGTIIVVDDMKKMADTLINYDDIVRNMNSGLTSNNMNFNRRLEKIVREIMR